MIPHTQQNTRLSDNLFSQSPVNNLSFDVDDDFDYEPESISDVPSKSSDLEARIDWLQGTIKQENVESFKGVLYAFFPSDGQFEERSRGLQGYKNSAVYRHNILHAWEPINTSTGGDHAFFSITGSALRTLSGTQVILLIHLLDKLGFRPSRIDLALWQYSKEFTPDIAHRWWYLGERGSQVKRFRSHLYYESSKSKVNKKGCDSSPLEKHSDDAIGMTSAFGRRGRFGGEKYLRIYDKTAESKGKIDCTAIELELKGNKALVAFKSLIDITDVLDVIASERLFANTIKSIIGGSIDFVDCIEWQNIFKDSDKVVLPCRKRNDVTATQQINWLNHQCAGGIGFIKSLYEGCKKLGLNIQQYFSDLPETFDGFIQSCKSRMNQKQRDSLGDFFAPFSEVTVDEALLISESIIPVTVPDPPPKKKINFRPGQGFGKDKKALVMSKAKKVVTVIPKKVTEEMERKRLEIVSRVQQEVFKVFNYFDTEFG